MLIGMFHIRKDPNKVSRAYLYSTIAGTKGMIFYFTAKGVDLRKGDTGKALFQREVGYEALPSPMSSSTPPTRTLFQEETKTV